MFRFPVAHGNPSEFLGWFFFGFYEELFAYAESVRFHRMSSATS